MVWDVANAIELIGLVLGFLGVGRFAGHRDLIGMVGLVLLVFGLSWFQALRELVMIAAFGLPIAYAAAFVWGAPVLYALHRLGWLRAAPIIAAGALGGTTVAVWFAFDQQGTLIRVHMPLAGGAVLGALVGGTCWWAGQGKA